MPPTGGPSGAAGCCGCSTGLAGQACFTVKGCPDFVPAVQAGAVVTVTKAGVTIGTATTDAAGQCCVSLNGQIVSTFSYSIVKSPYITATGTFGWSGGTTNVARTLNYDPATEVCLCGGPDLVTKPATLYLSDGSNSIALTGNVGCHVYSGISGIRKLDGSIGTGDVPVQYNTSLDSCTLNASWPIDSDGSGRPREAACGFASPACNVTVPRTSTSSSPLLVVYTYSGSSTGIPCGQPIPPFPGGATFSLSP